MKDNKAAVVALVLIIVVALAFVIYKVATGGKQKKVIDDEGRDVLEPLELDPNAVPLDSPDPNAVGGAGGG